MSGLSLFPYVRGYYPRDVLFRLWQFVERDGVSTKLFWAQQGPAQERGDVEAFVGYFTDAKRTVLVVAYEGPHGGDVAGLIWFDDIIPGYRAAVNVFYRRRYWRHAREATRLGVAWGFEHLRVQALWGYTPWPEAVRHAEACGFTRVAVLPGFGMCDGVPLDVTVVKQEKAP